MQGSIFEEIDSKDAKGERESEGVVLMNTLLELHKRRTTRLN